MHAAQSPSDTGLPAPGLLRPTLTPQEWAFARALKEVHAELKGATVAVGGTVILFTHERLPPDRFVAHLREAAQAFVRGIATIKALAPPPHDRRKRAYLGAAQRAVCAIQLLEAAARAATPGDRRSRLRRGSDRLARAAQRMRAIGETFWYPEYIPAISEGAQHGHPHSGGQVICRRHHP